MTKAEKELAEAFKAYIEAYGWEALEKTLQEQLGLVLVSDTGIQRAYERPDGKLKVTFSSVSQAGFLGLEANGDQQG